MEAETPKETPKNPNVSEYTFFLFAGTPNQLNSHYGYNKKFHFHQNFNKPNFYVYDLKKKAQNIKFPENDADELLKVLSQKNYLLCFYPSIRFKEFKFNFSLEFASKVFVHLADLFSTYGFSDSLVTSTDSINFEFVGPLASDNGLIDITKRIEIKDPGKTIPDEVLSDIDDNFEDLSEDIGIEKQKMLDELEKREEELSIKEEKLISKENYVKKCLEILRDQKGKELLKKSTDPELVELRENVLKSKLSYDGYGELLLNRVIQEREEHDSKKKEIEVKIKELLAPPLATATKSWDLPPTKATLGPVMYKPPPTAEELLQKEKEQQIESELLKNQEDLEDLRRIYDMCINNSGAFSTSRDPKVENYKKNLNESKLSRDKFFEQKQNEIMEKIEKLKIKKQQIHEPEPAAGEPAAGEPAAGEPAAAGEPPAPARVIDSVIIATAEKNELHNTHLKNYGFFKNPIFYPQSYDPRYHKNYLFKTDTIQNLGRKVDNNLYKTAFDRFTIAGKSSHFH